MLAECQDQFSRLTTLKFHQPSLDLGTGCLVCEEENELCVISIGQGVDVVRVDVAGWRNHICVEKSRAQRKSLRNSIDESWASEVYGSWLTDGVGPSSQEGADPSETMSLRFSVM